MSEKETKAQRIERIKREKTSWDIMPDIVKWSQQGFDAIPAEDLEVRLRQWGVYTQGDGMGVRGAQVPFFMMRVGIPGGALMLHQLRTLAELCEKYARSLADITDRQCIQFHWLRTEDLPEILFQLTRVGLTSMGACGDNARNVTGSPMAGVLPDELIDAGPIIQAVTRELRGNRLLANLPRKFKVTVSGSPDWSTYPEINDVGFQAVKAPSGDVGFSVRVGGGLSTRPHMGVKLDAFIEPNQVPHVARVICEIFRDSDVLRENRTKARLKYLFLDHGWNAENFLAEVESRLGYKLLPAVAETVPSNPYRDYVGINPQKQPGRYYAGFAVPTGRLSAKDLHAFADLAERYGSGQVRLTTMQNIVIVDIPETKLAAFKAAALEAVPYLVEDPSGFRRGILACTGSQFCKLAIVETKNFAIELGKEMERRLPGLGHQLRINVTGCPNSCGQHWVGDVGLMGVRVKNGAGEQVDGFEFFLGGGLGENPSFARRFAFKVASADVAGALERLVHSYEGTKLAAESFREWCHRLTDEELAAYLKGLEATAAE